MKAKRKAMTRLFGDWYKSYAELPRFFLALEMSNPGCIMYSKMVPGNNPNEEIFQRVFWAFAPSIKGFAHCRPVLSIDGTYLYGKYKGTLLIAIGCDASNFNTKFKYKTLKDLMCRASMESKRYGIMTTNMSEVFNGVLKGAHNLPITALIKAKVVKAGAHEVLLYDHVVGRFHVKTRHSVGSSNRKPRTYHVTLQTRSCTCNKTLLLGFPCSHILACHCRSIDFQQFVQGYIVLTLQDRHRSSTIRVNPDMERWRREAHIPYVVGEMTITLRDVAILFGLRVHGHPIRDLYSWSIPYDSFITTHFSHLPPGVVDEVTLQRHARAYLLLLVSGSLFPNKKEVYIQLAILPMLRDFGETAQYSWGNATLAHLYRELCRASLDSAESIAGPLHLLQLWSWERLQVGRPSRSLPHAPVPVDDRFPPNALGSRWRVLLSHTDTPHHVLVTYRDEFDRQRSDQVLWQPYTDDILALLPDICLADQDIWWMMSPLFFFYIVEWHRPERVLRQFDLHSIDRCGRPRFDWRLYHEHYVALWEARGPHYHREPIGPHMDCHAPYMTWYRGHALEDSDTDACRTGIVDIIRMTTDVMCIIREDYRLPHSTVARPPLVRGRSTSRGRGRYSSCQPITSSVSTSLYATPYFFKPTINPTLTSSDPPSVQPPTSLDLPPLQPPTSSDPPLVQIDTSTQLDLPPAISRGRRGLRRPRLLPPPPPLFPALTPSQIDVLHVSHAVPAIVREERPKRKRVPVTHRFFPCGGM
ncbi:hypothetical protein AAG906_006816 [Vitis piasezkii]